MLLELKVKDIGIIEDIDWKLDSGLNVITGETGAGKSLVIDAVELLLTGNAGEDIIRHGCSSARIEGVFTILEDPRYLPLKTFLDDRELSSEEGLLLVSCEIRRQKPVLIRINGHAATRATLRQIGQLLIDIHGQSNHLSLLDKKNHLDFLDAYANTLAARSHFAARVSRLHEIGSELKIIENQTANALRQEEFLKYQIDEIKKAELIEGEDDELEKEKHIISFSEKLQEYSQQIYQALCEGDSSRYSSSGLIKLNEALQAFKKLVDLDSSLQPQLEYVEKVVYGLEEVARDIRQYSDKLEYNPSRLEEIESRLDLIRSLKRKYGKTIGDILVYLEKCQQELIGFTSSSERSAQLKDELAALKKELGQLAMDLSQKRLQAAQQLMAGVKKELQDLEMSQIQFEIQVAQVLAEDGLPGSDEKLYAFTANGIDNVEFLVSTNPGEPLKPLARIASTGEISRFTLALKGALSEADNIPVLIFDEIDIGVGGRSGDILGKKLWSLARHHQVICVTHLPQIAAYADSHFCVHKELSGDRTTSILENLDNDSRLKELALMLAGPDYTETVFENARELTQKAGDWKRSFFESTI